MALRSRPQGSPLGQRWLTDARRHETERQREQVRELWLACHTSREIAALVDMPAQTVKDYLQSWTDLAKWQDPSKILAAFQETDAAGTRLFRPPLYNIWNFAAKTNLVTHFGNTEQRILENLLCRAQTRHSPGWLVNHCTNDTP